MTSYVTPRNDKNTKNTKNTKNKNTKEPNHAGVLIECDDDGMLSDEGSEEELLANHRKCVATRPLLMEGTMRAEETEGIKLN